MSNQTTVLEMARDIWDYHQMGHVLIPCKAALGLGSHDLGVPTLAAKLYHEGFFELIVFSGANSPTTRRVFPRGEAEHFAEHAAELGVPASRILKESAATNTSENFSLSRPLLEERGISDGPLLILCKPYMQRRAYATCQKVWPEVQPICASEDLSLEDYIEQIGDDKLVIDMLVGDLQRVDVYGKKGFAIEQYIPPRVSEAYDKLVQLGYTSRLL